MKESLEEVQAKYKLSAEEEKRIQEDIIEMMLYGKTPVQNPTAFFHIGPPGSGKTGLNGYGVKQVPDNNIIVINNDELKTFHPKADEISRLYPEHYIKVTNESSKVWTDALMDRALELGYNVIYEGTGRKIKIFEKMISKMKQYSYGIVVRAMAVNELNCLMSILERYEYQVQRKGWGRLVAVDTFYKAYDNEMLDTIDIFENLREISAVEVYKRGAEPSNPIKIYSSDDNSKGFPSARQAVIGGRAEDAEKALKYFPFHKKAMLEILKDKELSEDEKAVLKKIQELYNELSKEISDYLCREIVTAMERKG